MVDVKQLFLHGRDILNPQKFCFFDIAENHSKYKHGLNRHFSILNWNNGGFFQYSVSLSQMPGKE
jgi:hypothetical protein